MRDPAPKQAVRRIHEANPFGDVTLVPAEITGMPQAQLAMAMADILSKTAPTSGAEALQRLRAAFPSSPLSVRVAVLAAMARKFAHIPR